MTLYYALNHQSLQCVGVGDCLQLDNVVGCAPDGLPGMRGSFARINGKLQDGTGRLLLWPCIYEPKKEGRCCVPLMVGVLMLFYTLDFDHALESVI